ncbi:hypothetical protein [Legionella bozemanae]|uniref:Uncharacterized protein n=1 Tax=Legionella bozemanae TaxID=447 RepID=A0A0W0RXY3_LEGBO|nr:hypothetical protein [Legionella bozemanae]KTC75896.1 hypothetical protein Lboz_0724 [Legionella bozemanae]STO35479.1 Uncharacterised protein [Legionella bozemanae]
MDLTTVLLSGALGTIGGAGVSGYLNFILNNKKQRIQLITNKINNLYAPINLHIEIMLGFNSSFIEKAKPFENLKGEELDFLCEAVEKTVTGFLKHQENQGRIIKETIIKNYALVELEDLKTVNDYIKSYTYSLSHIADLGISEKEINLIFTPNTFEVFYPSIEFVNLFRNKYLHLKNLLLQEINSNLLKELYKNLKIKFIKYKPWKCN